jgi:hypothetical protein
LAAFRAAYDRISRLRETVGQMPPSPATVRGAIGKLLVQLMQRCLFWYTPQITRFQNELTNVLDSTGKLMAFQLERAAALERDHGQLRAEQLERTAALEDRREKLRAAQSEWTAALEKNAEQLSASVAEVNSQVGRLKVLVAPLAPVRPDQADGDPRNGHV